MSEPVDRHSPGRDFDLDDYLGGDSQVSRRYRALTGVQDEAVPPELDELILAQARRAVVPEESMTASRTDEMAPSDELAALRAKRRRLLQWSIPTALAASLVVVVSIVMRGGVEHEVRGMTTLPAMPVENRLPEPAKDLPTAAPARQEAAGQREGERELTANENSRQSSTAVTRSQPVPSGPAASRDRDAKKATQDLSRAAVANHASLPPPLPELEEVQIAEVPPPVAAPAPPQSVSSASSANDTAIAQSAAQMTRKERDEPLAGTAARAAFATPAKVDAARLQADPEAWLKLIRELRRQGEHELADRQWESFIARYPTYPVAESDPARTAQTP